MICTVDSKPIPYGIDLTKEEIECLVNIFNGQYWLVEVSERLGNSNFINWVNTTGNSFPKLTLDAIEYLREREG